jgi:hypothetical protein
MSDCEWVPAWRRRWEREQRLAQSAREMARKRPRPAVTVPIPEAAKRYTTLRAQHMVAVALEAGAHEREL